MCKKHSEVKMKNDRFDLEALWFEIKGSNINTKFGGPKYLVDASSRLENDP